MELSSRILKAFQELRTKWLAYNNRIPCEVCGGAGFADCGSMPGKCGCISCYGLGYKEGDKMEMDTLKEMLNKLEAIEAGVIGLKTRLALAEAKLAQQEIAWDVTLGDYAFAPGLDTHKLAEHRCYCASCERQRVRDWRAHNTE